jgi:hypothetical protein
VAAAGVVPAFDPFEDRCGEVGAAWPGLPVEQFALQGEKNDSIIVLSTLEATRPIEPSSPACRSR